MNNYKIGLISLISLVVGNLVGSGVFLLPATLANYGSISILGWVVTSIGAITLALIFAELSNYLPKTGGPYAYVSDAFGKDMGYFIAWGYWVLAWVSNSALLAAAVGYYSSIVGDLSIAQALSFEIGALIVITYLNLFGIKTAGQSKLIITIVKLIPLIILPLISIFYIKTENFSPINIYENNFLGSLNAVAFLTLWGFVGIETATVPGNHVINPGRNIPLATIIGTLIAAFIYILGTVAIFGVVPQGDLINSKAPYADMASAVFGGSWGLPIAIAAIISCIGTLNGWTIITGRISQAAAQDDLFPAIFAKTNKYDTPYMSIIISSCLTIPFILFSIQEDLLKQFNMIIDISVTFILIIYLACVLAMLKIYHRDKKLSSYRIILGCCGLFFTLWALWAASYKIVCLSLILILLGMPMWIYRRKVNSSQRY